MFGASSFSMSVYGIIIPIIVHLACFPWRAHLLILLLMLPATVYSLSSECMKSQWLLLVVSIPMGELLGYSLQWLLRSLWLKSWLFCAKKEWQLQQQEQYVWEMEVARREQLRVQQRLVAKLHTRGGHSKEVRRTGAARDTFENRELLKQIHRGHLSGMMPIDERSDGEGSSHAR